MPIKAIFLHKVVQAADFAAQANAFQNTKEGRSRTRKCSSIKRGAWSRRINQVRLCHALCLAQYCNFRISPSPSSRIVSELELPAGELVNHLSGQILPAEPTGNSSVSWEQCHGCLLFTWLQLPHPQCSTSCRALRMILRDNRYDPVCSSSTEDHAFRLSRLRLRADTTMCASRMLRLCSPRRRWKQAPKFWRG